MRSLASGEAGRTIEVHGDDEFAELAKGYNAMAGDITETSRKLKEAEQRSDALLHSLYPAGLADRLRSGAEIAAETITNVTVAVTWIDGLEALAAERSAVDMSEVLNTLLGALNAAANAHGVEPLRSLGETHIAVCGLSSPRLDHASRTLDFAVAATLAVRRLNEDWARSVGLRFGLASGPIDVLLLSHGHTAYDIWGHPLSVARRISFEERPGNIRASDSTYALLADVTGFQACAPIENLVLGTLTTWSRPAVMEPVAEGARPSVPLPTT